MSGVLCNVDLYVSEFWKAVFAKSLETSVEADTVGKFFKMHLKVRILSKRESLEDFFTFSESIL